MHAGVAISIAGLGIILEALFIIVQLLTLGVVNSMIKVLLLFVSCCNIIQNFKIRMYWLLLRNCGRVNIIEH